MAQRRLSLLIIIALSVLAVATAAATAAAAPTRSLEPWGPQVRSALQHDTSPPLRELARRSQPAAGLTAPDRVGQINRILPAKALSTKIWEELSAQGHDPLTYFQQTDPVIQTQASAALMPAALQNFEGTSQIDQQSVSLLTVTPPDTVGDIGYDPVTGKRYYVQWVNLAFSIWDVTGAPQRLLLAKGNTLWSDLGGPCGTTNDGDPSVLFDQLANRWLLAQFAQPNYPAGPFYQCVAVSSTADPTGAYYRYAFQMSETKLNDYPHFGIWPDGYYMTANQFQSGVWAGALAVVFEREAMLAGQAARLQAFDLFDVQPLFGGMLPADLEGMTPPPAGMPAFFAEVDDNSVAELGSYDALRLWQFHTDWKTPANSTFGIQGLPNTTLSIAPFNVLPCVLLGSRSCIAQPNSAQLLDGVGDRLMHRLTYRNLGTHDMLLLNHTVDAGGGRAGIRWYELRSPAATPAIFQQGTYAPDDILSRWMGSIAMDHFGNIALGYSIASQSLFPSIRYAGRLVDDPLGQLAQGEATLVAGSGAQTGSSRWGDYSALSIDPVDDCTFWYTQEYYPVTANFDWHTRIASFRFPNCRNAPSGSVQGTLRDAVTRAPLAQARLQISSGPDLTIGLSVSAGAYTYTLPIGVYTFTASAYGYTPLSVHPVAITTNLMRVQDLLLSTGPTHVISGYVTDGTTGDPLYAALAISGTLFNPPFDQVFTDPVTGYYSATLAAGQSYTLTVSAPLHVTQTRGVPILISARNEDFALTPDTSGSGLLGWVRNANTRSPVMSATVIISPGLSVSTDHAGYFEALNLAPGLYTATASAPLYAPITHTAIDLKPHLAAVRVFALPAAQLKFNPAALEQALAFGKVFTQAAGLVLSNTGQLPLDFRLEEFPATVDVTAAPLQGTISPSATQAVTLTWRGDLVEQPGVYSTTLWLNTTDPEAQQIGVSLTLTVQPTAAQGRLTGVISTTGYCDVHPAPLAGAQLMFRGFDGFTRALTADASGRYSYWLDRAHSPYTVTVSASDHLTTGAKVSISGNVTTTQDFTLRLQQPCFQWSPAAIMVSPKAGLTVTQQVIVTNSGALPLTAKFYEVYTDTLGGGPDAAGYTWRPSPYQWIDASAGIPLNLGDDDEATIILPFDFPFYDIASNRLRIGNNGAALFDVTTGEVSALNQPMDSAPDGFIAPYWDDLGSVPGLGNVYWQTLGNAPQRRVVVMWSERPHASGSFGVVTFEMILHENGNLEFQYQQTSFGVPSLDNGASATLGVRGNGPAQSLQVSYNAPSISPRQAICFTRPGNAPCDMVDDPWWSVSPVSVTGLSGTPPHQQMVTLTFTAPVGAPVGVHDLYSGRLRLVNNDPLQPNVNLQLQMKVIAYRAYLPLMWR